MIPDYRGVPRFVSSPTTRMAKGTTSLAGPNSVATAQGVATRKSGNAGKKRSEEQNPRWAIDIRLVSYPPYHSKCNPIERCWSSLQRKWTRLRDRGVGDRCPKMEPELNGYKRREAI